jgi:hypothetical protein
MNDYDFFPTVTKTAVDEFIETKMSMGIAYECLVPNTCYGCFAVLSRKG